MAFSFGDIWKGMSMISSIFSPGVVALDEYRDDAIHGVAGLASGYDPTGLSGQVDQYLTDLPTSVDFDSYVPDDQGGDDGSY